MSTPSAMSGTGLVFASSLYRPDITFRSISVETASVVLAESRSLTVSSRLMTMDLLLPPPPPPPPPPALKTPQPGIASMAAPARPVPLIFRKSFRDIPGARRTPSPFIHISSILMDSPFPSRRSPHGSRECPFYRLKPLYGDLLTPDALLGIPETLYLRSISPSLTFMQ